MSEEFLNNNATDGEEPGTVQEAAAALLRRVEFLREAGLRELYVPAAVKAALEEAAAPSAVAAAGPTVAAAPCQSCALGPRDAAELSGEGAATPLVLFVGGAPSEKDVEAGLAYSGEERELLLKIIGAMGLGQNEFRMTLSVRCAPASKEEATAAARSCAALLDEEIGRVNPKMIVALGEGACMALTGKALSEVSGRQVTYKGVRAVPTFEPSEIIKRPELKKEVWRHVKAVMASLGRPVAQ